MKKIHCPACNKNVRPIAFQFWPGASVNICPTCRIGIGTFGNGAEVKSIAAPRRDKMVRAAGVNK